MNLLRDIPLCDLYHKIKQKASNCGFHMHRWKVQDVFDLIGNGCCAYTGKEFTAIDNATFERVNPELGYVPGNVLMVTQMANSCKSNLDAFVKNDAIPDAMKIKLMRKALYQLEKRGKHGTV